MPLITVCGFQFDQNDFHRILKPKILQYLKVHGVNFAGIGSNPDITCKKGLLILTGQRGGGKVDTNIELAAILKDLGYLQD